MSSTRIPQRLGCMRTRVAMQGGCRHPADVKLKMRTARAGSFFFRFSLGLVLSAMAVAVAPPASADQPGRRAPPCAAPTEITRLDYTLARTARRLAGLPSR